MTRPRTPTAWLLVALLAGPADAQPPPANLLVDGSFEADGLPDWHPGSWRGTFRAAATESWDVRDGLRAAVIRVDGPADDALLTQVVAVKPRTRYRLTGWVLATRVVVAEPGASTGANLSLPGRPERSGSVVGDSEWSLLGFEFETGEEDRVEVAARLGHHGSTARGEAWFDDLRLVEVGPGSRLPPRAARATPPAPAPAPPSTRARPRPGPEAILAGALSLLAVLLVLGLMRWRLRRAWGGIAARTGPEASPPGRRVDPVRVGLMAALAGSSALSAALAGGGWWLLVAAFPTACALAGRRGEGRAVLRGQAGGLAQSIPLAVGMVVEGHHRRPPFPAWLPADPVEAGAWLVAASILAGWAAGMVVEGAARLAIPENPGEVGRP